VSGRVRTGGRGELRVLRRSGEEKARCGGNFSRRWVQFPFKGGRRNTAEGAGGVGQCVEGGTGK
jgi:hypothetical protein